MNSPFEPGTPFSEPLNIDYGHTGPVAIFEPTVFEIDLEDYLSTALGVPVWAGKVPSGSNQKAAHLVYSFISATTDQDLDGPSGVQDVSIQFDAYSNNRRKSAVLIETMRSVIDGFSGMMGGTEVLNVTEESSSHGSDDPVGGSEAFSQRRMIEFVFTIRKNIPEF